MEEEIKLSKEQLIEQLGGASPSRSSSTFDFKGPRIASNRTTVPTLSLKEKPTPLNNKKIIFSVCEGSSVVSSMFSAGSVLFKVRTEPLGFEVKRKDSEFAFLRKILVR